MAADFVGLDLTSSDGADASWELGVSGCEHVRMQLVGEKVTEQAGAVGVIFTPAEVVIGVEVGAGFDLATEPSFPIDVFVGGPFFDVVVPLAFRGVAHVGTLAENGLADLTGADQFGGLVPFAIGAALGADLEDLFGAANGIVDLECLAEVTGHGLLDVNVLAGLHGIDGDTGVPMIDRGAADGVDVFSFQEFSVFIVALAIAADVFFGFADAGFGDIGYGGEGDVGIGGIFFLATDVGHALAANADEADDDPVICADDAAGGGRLILAVDGGFENVCDRDGGRGRGGRFDELSAASVGGRERFFSVFHKPFREC